MRGETVELLADVGLGGEQDRLLMQPVGVEALRGRSSVATCSASRALIASGLRPGAFSARAASDRDFVKPRGQKTAERCAFRAPHGDE